MPRPPFVLSSVFSPAFSPVFSRSAFLALLSWRLCSTGEDELQDRHGERYHSYADDRPCGDDGGCGALVPVVGLKDHDIGGRRQDSQDEEHLRVGQ